MKQNKSCKIYMDLITWQVRQYIVMLTLRYFAGKNHEGNSLAHPPLLRYGIVLLTTLMLLFKSASQARFRAFLGQLLFKPAIQTSNCYSKTHRVVLADQKVRTCVLLQNVHTVYVRTLKKLPLKLQNEVSVPSTPYKTAIRSESLPLPRLIVFS